MQITAVTKQKNGSYDVYVDGEKFEGLDAVILASHRNIKVGCEIEREEIEDIKRRSGESLAFDAAIRHLSRTLRSESEIRERLEQKGFTEESANGAIAKLRSYGYINDLAYAHAYVSTYGKDRGRLRLSYELSAKGISKEIIDEVMPEDEEEIALRLAEKKAKKYTEKEKLVRYLMSRGFDYEISKRVSTRVLSGEDE